VAMPSRPLEISETDKQKYPKLNLLELSFLECERGDSNPYSVTRWILRAKKRNSEGP
jgi:hypothetical protein